MSIRPLAIVLALAAAGCFASAGCSAESDDDEAVQGDGSGGENEIVSERQLNGNELPDHTLSLTFDDGPGDRTSELADFLAEKGIKATFFMNGMRAPGRQRHIDTVIARGHILANHTQNHKQLTRLSSAEVIREVTQTDDVIKTVQPNGPWLLRAPFGAWNGSIARTLNGTPMSKYVGSIFWDEGGVLTATAAADWDCWGHRMSIESCGALYMNEIRSKRRGVVLMHDIQNKTVDMVKLIVPKLAAEGFKFAAITDVPSVKRNLAASGGGGGGSDQRCSSATLGRVVDENVCVQSRTDQRWFRCVDGEWIASAGPGDAACTQRFPL